MADKKSLFALILTHQGRYRAGMQPSPEQREWPGAHPREEVARRLPGPSAPVPAQGCLRLEARGPGLLALEPKGRRRQTPG